MPSFSNITLFLTFVFVGLVYGDNTTCQSNTKYPNQCQITKIFDHLSRGNFDAFFSHVAEDVQWTLMGTHPLAGEYHNRTIFIVDALKRLANTLTQAHPSKLELTSVIGGGDEAWSAQELHGTGVCKNGKLDILLRIRIIANTTA